MKLVLFMVICFACATLVAAQDDEDVQSWNDVQINVPLSKQVDYFNKVTMRIGKNITRLNDGRFAVGLVWKPTKALSISPFYWLIKARNAAGKFRIENRLNLAATYRFPLKRVGLSHRSTYERRLRSTVNTWRYRAMITLEKDIPKSIIAGAKWFLSNEVFYDSVTKRFSRNRFSVGISKTISKRLSVDIFYMRQNDGFSHPGDLNSLWAAWKIRY